MISRIPTTAWLIGFDDDWQAWLREVLAAEGVDRVEALESPERFGEIAAAHGALVLVDAGAEALAGSLRDWLAGRADQPPVIVVAAPDTAGVLGALIARGALFCPRDRQYEEVLRQLVRQVFSQPQPSLQTIIDAIPCPIFFKDADLRYLGCNRSFEEVSGVSQQDLLGKTVADVASESNTRMIQSLDSELMATGGIQDFTMEVRFADGSDHRMRIRRARFEDSHGVPRGITGVMIDLTHEAELERTHTLLAAAMNHAAEMIVITDVEGVIRYVNPAFERVTGYAAAEAVGQHTRLLKSDCHKESFYQQMWETLLAGGVWSGQLINRRKNGSTYPEEATISQVHDADGRLVAYVAVKREVTREIELQRQLTQAYKMEAIGTLASGIAHDFNNILTIINGFLQLADAKVTPGSKVAGYIRQAQAGGQRAAEMVTQILTFSRQNDEARRPIDICPVAREIVKFMRGSLPSTITITCETGLTTAVVMANATEVHQVLMNLCTNASQAIGGKQGSIHLRLDRFVADGTRECTRTVDPLTPGAYVRVEVSDTGPGIPVDIQHRIFDPYFTTKPQGEGTGMGLAVVHGIVSRSGGSVELESGPGLGASFRIYLPLVEENLQTQARETTIPPGHGERILVVDDEPNIAQMASELLTNLGYNVTTCHDSRLALAHVQADPQALDVVLTDLTMPGLTGVELANRIAVIRPDLPLILWTGFADAMKGDSSVDLGFAAVIRKPFDLSALANGIHEVLRKHGRR